MNANQNFAIEQLEARHETLWILIPRWYWCYRYIFGIPFPYLCLRWVWIWV